MEVVCATLAFVAPPRLFFCSRVTEWCDFDKKYYYIKDQQIFNKINLII